MIPESLKDITPLQLLARYVLLGADLRELDEICDSEGASVTQVKEVLSDIIKQYNQIADNA